MSTPEKIFPIKAGQKYPPLIKDWPNQAKTFEDWGGKDHVFGNVNWGVSCAGQIVVDIDPRNVTDQKAVTDLLAKLPDTYTVDTPNGGMHLYYSLPADHPGVANSASKLAAGVDVKSNGGYVVRPHSKTDKGEYKVDLTQPLDKAPAPQWLIEACGAPIPKAEHQADIPDADDELVERAREWITNDVKQQGIDGRGYKVACGLRDLGLSEAQALLLMEEADPRAGKAEENVSHAYEFAKGTPGNKTATIDDFEEYAEDLSGVKEEADKAIGKAKTPLVWSTFRNLIAPDRKRPRYLVKGLLNQKSYALMYGAPGSGKTFTAFELVHSVVTGQDFLGRKSRQGAVLYLAYEGYGGIGDRALALRQKHNTKDDIPLYFHCAAFNMRTDAGKAGVMEIYNQLPQKPALIVIDTLAYALGGGDENSAKDVGAFNSQIKAIIDATGACVLVIHHCGKNAENGARGSSALLGAVDTELLIDSNQIQPTKQREMELGASIGFALHSVQVDLDEDGDAVTSCYVMQAPTGPKRPKLNKRAQQAKDALLELGGLTDAVPLSDWKEAFKRAVWPSGEAADNTVRVAFDRAATDLINAGILTIDQDSKEAKLN